MLLELAILKNFDTDTYKAGVQLAGSLTTYFDDVPVSRSIPTSALVVGNKVILAIPGDNPKDACVIAAWPQGSPGGAEVHGNEFHDPDFEQQGVAASLIETHRTTETHTQPQPAAEHGNEKHAQTFLYSPLGADLDFDSYNIINTGPDTPYGLHKLAVYLYPTNAGWYTATIGSASVAQLPIYISIASGATTLSSASAYTHPVGLSQYVQSIDWTCAFKFYLKGFTVTLNDPANENAWVHFVQTTTFPIGNLTARGIGLRVGYKDAGSPRELYICSHDGAAYSELDTGVNLTTDAVYSVEIVWTPGVSIQAYLNGVLAGTKTTNLPSGTGGASRFGMAFQRSGGSDTHAYDGIKLYYPALKGIPL
jgi:hypothetical protein